MPSLLHELLVDLFRQRVTLAGELLSEALGLKLPAEARVDESSLTQIAPAAYAADLVVLFGAEDAEYGVVVEAQLRVDPNKRYSWPLYGAGLRARARCPVAVLVVTPDAAVASWARAPIELGVPGSVFRPVVLGPEEIPWVTDPEMGRRAPELALLSALAHGNEPSGVAVVIAALSGAETLDAERGALYFDFLMSSLEEAVRRELESMNRSENWEPQSEWGRRMFGMGREEGREEGRASGRADVLLRIAERRGWSLGEALRARIVGCRDVALLDRWVDRALDASTMDEVFSDGSV